MGGVSTDVAVSNRARSNISDSSGSVALFIDWSFVSVTHHAGF